MTRRVFVYLCEDGSFAVSPEFNGDREEFKLFQMGDSYDLSFGEMCQIMERVTSLEEFKEAVTNLEKAGHSQFGQSPLTGIRFVCEVDELEDLSDNVYLVGHGTCKQLDEPWVTELKKQHTRVQEKVGHLVDYIMQGQYSCPFYNLKKEELGLTEECIGFEYSRCRACIVRNSDKLVREKVCNSATRLTMWLTYEDLAVSEEQFDCLSTLATDIKNGFIAYAEDIGLTVTTGSYELRVIHSGSALKEQEDIHNE